MDLTTLILVCIPLFATLVVVTEDVRMQKIMKKK